MSKKRESSLKPALDVLQSLFQKSKGSFSVEYDRMRLEKNWAQIVGAELAKESRPRKIFKTTLYISCESSEARYHFRFSQDVILKKIAEFLERKYIDHLSFKAAKTKSDYSDKAKNFVDKLK